MTPANVKKRAEWEQGLQDTNFEGSYRFSGNISADVSIVKVVYNQVGCTGVDYHNTKFGKEMDANAEVQQHRAEKIAATGTGFNDWFTHSIENVLGENQSTGNKYFNFYPCSGTSHKTEYFICFDKGDWIPATKAEIAYFFTASERDKTLNPNSVINDKLQYQVKIISGNGVNVNTGSAVDSAGNEVFMATLDDGTEVKLLASPIRPMYYCPDEFYRGIIMLRQGKNIVSAK